MKRVTSAFGLFGTLILIVTGASEAAASNRVLNYMLIGKDFLVRCGEGFSKANPNFDEAKFNANYRLLLNSLANKAARLHPDLTLDEVDAALQKMIEGRSQALANLPENANCETHRGRMFIGKLASDDIAAYAERYKTQVLPYNRTQPVLTSAARAQTYAYKSTQVNLLRTIIGIVFKDTGCKGKDLDVVEVEVLLQETREADGLPIFVLASKFYNERWRTHCAGVEKTVTVKFSQDSDGGIGLYSVEQVEPPVK